MHVQFPDGYVKLSHFCDLLKLDTCHNGLRAVPKLSANHVEPNNLQRMNVRLAVQVRSFVHVISNQLFNFCWNTKYRLKNQAWGNVCIALKLEDR